MINLQMNPYAFRLLLWLMILFIIVSGCTFPDQTEIATSGQQQPQNPEETIAYLYALQTYEALARTRQVEAIAEQTASAPTIAPTQESSPTPAPSETPSPTTSPTSSSTPLPSRTQAAVYATATDPPSPPPNPNTPVPPTNTPASPSPTSSQTAPASSSTHKLCYYGNGQFEVPYNQNGPNLDGDIHYWTAPKYTVPYVIYGWKDYAGDYDVDGYFQLGWNEEALFIAVKVQDERYKQFADGPSILYQGDSIEVLIDADLCGDFNDTSMNADDYQIGISPGYVNVDGPKYVFQWFPTQTKLPSVVVGSSRTPEDITFYEVKIPWAVLGISSPRAGSAFGFTLSISDNDNIQYEIQQTVISSHENRAFNPLTWGTIILN